MEKQLIRNKINQLLDYAKEHDVIEVTKEINNIFSQDEIIANMTNINQAYYDENIKHILIKGGNGLEISIMDGDGERLGSLHTHDGTDIEISSKILGKSDSLFFENNYVTDNRISEIIDETLDLEFPKELVINYFNTIYADPLVFNILSDDLRNNDDVINATISRINNDAYAEHREQKDYEDISPYGGLDIIVQKKSEIFLEKMDMFDMPGNEYFMESAKKYFMSDIDNYKFISEEIDRFNKIIYIADHEDDYRRNNEIEEQIYLNYEVVGINRQEYENELNDINKQIESCLQTMEQNEGELQKYSKQLDNILNKKYSFITYFTMRPQDYREKIKLNEKLSSLQQEMLDLNGTYGKLKFDKIDLENKFSIISDSDKLEKELVKLDVKYNYLLRDSFSESYYCDPGAFEESLQRQVSAKDDIIAKRDIYEDLLKYKDSNINLNISNIDATKKHENIIIREYGHDIEYVNVLITDKYSVYVNGGDEIRILDNDKQSFLDEENGYQVYKKIIDDVTTNRIIPSYDKLTSYINQLKENHNSDSELNEEDLEME